jgi:hypothetical protein
MITAVSLAIKALSAAPSVTAITSTRIVPAPVPQDMDLPAIAVALSAESEEMLLGGSSQYPESSVQVHCLYRTSQTSSGDVLDLGETVKLALRDLLFTSGSIRASFTKEPVDFTDFSDNASTHRRVMSFSVRWR